jgi:hypothetical protein
LLKVLSEGEYFGTIKRVVLQFFDKVVADLGNGRYVTHYLIVLGVGEVPVDFAYQSVLDFV